MRPSEFHVAEGRAQADPWDATPDQQFQTAQLRLQLPTSLGVDEGVKLVDDNVGQRSEHMLQFGPAADEQSLQRLWCNQQDSSRRSQDFGLPLSTDIAMPTMYGDVELLAQVFKSLKLVVDECLEWPDVEGSDSGRF